MADSDCDEDDWERVKLKKDLTNKEDGGDDLVIDNIDKSDNDNCDDNCGDHMSCNASIITEAITWYVL